MGAMRKAVAFLCLCLSGVSAGLGVMSIDMGAEWMKAKDSNLAMWLTVAITKQYYKNLYGK
jgi:hypothetical protein